MNEDRDPQTRPEPDTAKERESVKDLNAKPIDEKDAQQIRGGRAYADELPKE